MIIAFRGEKGSGKSTAAEIVRDILIPAPVQIISFADPLKEFVGDLFDFSHDVMHGASELRDQPVAWDDDRAWQVYNRAKLIMPSKIDRWARELGRPLVTNEVLINFWKWLSSVTDHPECKRGVITPRRPLQTFGTEFGRVHFGPDVWWEIAFARANRFERAQRRTAYTLIPDARFDNEIEAVRARGGKTCDVRNIERPPPLLRELTHASELRGGAFSDFEVINEPSKGRQQFREQLAPVIERIIRHA